MDERTYTQHFVRAQCCVYVFTSALLSLAQNYLTLNQKYANLEKIKGFEEE
jgi:uncharacterized membrane protein YesL